MGEARRILNSFLVFLESAGPQSIVVAATNHNEISLDRALFRRFDLVLNYWLPSSEEAVAVLGKVKARLGPLGIGVDWKPIRTVSDGMSHAELVKAAETAAKRSLLSGVPSYQGRSESLPLRWLKPYRSDNVLTVPDGAGPLPHLLVHGYVEDREFARGGGGGNPKVRPVERRAHGERVKSEADTALATQDARRESLVELESLGVVITIEGATGFRLKLDSLEQRTTHTRPRLADRCQPAPAPTQRRAAVRPSGSSVPIRKRFPSEKVIWTVCRPQMFHIQPLGCDGHPRRTTRGSVGVRQQRCATARSSCSAIRARMRVVPRSGSRSP